MRRPWLTADRQSRIAAVVDPHPAVLRVTRPWVAGPSWWPPEHGSLGLSAAGPSGARDRPTCAVVTPARRGSVAFTQIPDLDRCVNQPARPARGSEAMTRRAAYRVAGLRRRLARPEYPARPLSWPIRPVLLAAQFQDPKCSETGVALGLLRGAARARTGDRVVDEPRVTAAREPVTTATSRAPDDPSSPAACWRHRAPPGHTSLLGRGRPRG